MLWTDVYNALMQEYTATITGPRGLHAQGPAAPTGTKMPIGVALAAFNNCDQVDANQVGQEVAMAAETYGRPATEEDFRRLVNTGQPLPTIKVIKAYKKQPSGDTRRGDPPSPGQQGKRPPKPKWTCTAVGADGKVCGAENHHYAKPDWTDRALKTACAKCRAPRPTTAEPQQQQALAAQASSSIPMPPLQPADQQSAPISNQA